MFETPLINADHPTTSPSLVLPDELIEFYGQCYARLPAITRRRLSFVRYLVYRNGGLFEKLRHHRNHRNGATAFRAIVKGSQ